MFRTLILLLLMTSTIAFSSEFGKFNPKYYIISKDNVAVLYDSETNNEILNIIDDRYLLLNEIDLKLVMEWKVLSKKECKSETIREIVTEYETKYKTKNIIKNKYSTFEKVLFIGGAIALGVIGGYIVGTYQKL